MKQKLTLSAILVLAFFITAGFTIGCGPDEPEYTSTYEPASFQRQQQRQVPRQETTPREPQKEYMEVPTDEDGNMIIPGNNNNNTNNDNPQQQTPNWQNQ